MFDDLLNTLKDTVGNNPIVAGVIGVVVVASAVSYGVTKLMQDDEPKKEEKPITTES